MGNLHESFLPNNSSFFSENNCQFFSEEEHTGAIGLVVRDSNGALVRAQALWSEYADSSLVMEALAIRDGARLAIDRGYLNVEIETDAREVVKLTEDPGGGRSCLPAFVKK
jgi:hypothetical protein